MDPISPLQFTVNPELRAGRISKAGEGSLGRVISSGELEGLAAGRQPAALSSTSPAPGAFESAFNRLVNEVNGKQAAAGDAVAGLLGGQNVSLHQAMIAMEEASVSFQLMVEVRNKLLESYQELMRMQI
jgi:flagellar hook-basal body complex protein FliE